jgi:uncharacterized protein YprB with RNaseH-like and TPR domain
MRSAGTVAADAAVADLTEFEPRVLVVDIETMANLAWVWGVWQQNVSPKQIVKHKRTISFAAKWLGEKKVSFYSEFHDGREAMVHAAWKMLDDADAVVGYNSKRFDIKHLNTEFSLEHIGPPSHFQHIDLYQIARREFAHGSNKLESIATRLGLGHKREHEGFGLWLKCEAGDEGAWKRMRAYNKQDVRLTESLFDEFRPWIALRGTSSQKRLRQVLEAA